MRGWGAKRDCPPNKQSVGITRPRKLGKLDTEWLEAAAVRVYCFALTGEVPEALLLSVLFGEQSRTRLVIDCARFLKPLEISRGVQPLPGQ